MRCFHHPDTVLHQPPQFLVRGQPKPVPEKPERVVAVLDALNRRNDRIEQAPDAGPAARAAVHSPEYLARTLSIKALVSTVTASSSSPSRMAAARSLE